MMPGAAVSEAWEELLSCGGRLASSKSNALAPWRFEPWCMMMPENNCEDAALTLALQKQLCSANNNNGVNDVSSNGFVPVSAICKAESEVSSGSDTDGGRNLACGGVKGFDFESPPQREEGGRSVTASKSSGPLCVNGSGKVSKRRSRAASKSPIMFLNADPANFRAMVQQVTGVPLNPNVTRLWGTGGGGISMPALLKPEPKRPSASSSAACGGGGGGSHVIQGLPTLDTSALFINSARLASAATSAADFATFAPPPLVRSAAARPPPQENELFTDKLRAAYMQSFMKNGGGDDGGSGGFVAEQGSQGMNLAHEADSWLNNNGFPDGLFADFNGSASFGASLPV